MSDINIIYITLACVLGILMTWSVGANDLANIMSTTMGSKAISVRRAITIAILFEFAGAFFGSNGVSNTLRNGIIDTSTLMQTPDILIYGMLAALAAGTTWMIIASYFGLPVSITNTIVGAIVGFGSIVIGINAMHWQQVGYIAISWIASPTMAGLVAYLLMVSIQRFVFGAATPFRAAQRRAPFYLFLVGVILAFMVIFKGLKHFEIPIQTWQGIIIIIITGLMVMALGLLLMRRITVENDMALHVQFVAAEKIFGILMALTACAMVFAHGSNDVAVAVGPMASVITIAQAGDHIPHTLVLPAWIIFLGASGIILGLITYGRKIIINVGSGITALTPSRAFAATLAAASTVVVSTSFGIPVSATQTLVGAILGVGLARGIGALNLRMVRNIFMSWIITLPMGASLAIGYFYLFKWMFK